MPNINDNTLHRLDVLNNWLGDVFDEETNFGTLLIDAGFSEAEIEEIKQNYLGEFLRAIISLLDCDIDQRKMLMVQYYGLIDGKPQDYYVLGHGAGVCGQRIKQLVHKRLGFYREPKQQATFRDGFAAIGRQLLDNNQS